MYFVFDFVFPGGRISWPLLFHVEWQQMYPQYALDHKWIFSNFSTRSLLSNEMRVFIPGWLKFLQFGWTLFGYISPCSGLRMSCLWTHQHLVSWCSDFLYVACKGSAFCFLSGPPHVGGNSILAYISQSLFPVPPSINSLNLRTLFLPFSAIFPIYRTFLEWGE